MKTSQIFVFLILALLATLSGTADAQEPLSAYESYFNYIGTAPYEAETKYAEEVNGITHDSDNWYIAQSTNAHPWRLWKIPLGVHLAATFDCGDTVGPYRVACRYLDDYDELSAYNHIGDIDYYQYNPTTGFLLLPLEDYPDKAVSPAIAVFDPVNLQYIAHAELQLPPQFPQPKNAPWVAVNRADGRVYTSYEGVEGWVFEFYLNWDTLAPDNMSLQYVEGGEFELLDESGAPLGIGGQGAVFSDSGDLLYVNNGYLESYDSHRDGISVFNMQTKQRFRHSTRDCTQPFCYDFDTWGEWEEPEGLTIWDTDDDPRTPEGMSGQLHVLLLDNDWLFGDNDDVYVMHYTNKIYVDRGYSGEERGKPTQPFNTVGEAYSMAWDGSLMMIKAGSYPESLTLSKRVELHAVDDTVIIGQ